jgi:HSP20 family molecular chaperone IbpA
VAILVNGIFSLNVLGIDVGGLIGSCIQTIDNIIALQTYNNENITRSQPEYQVNPDNVQQQHSNMEDQHSMLQWPGQQLLEPLQLTQMQQILQLIEPLIQQTLQLTQMQQILQLIEPLVQQTLQLSQMHLQPLQQSLQHMPSLTYSISTTNLLDDSADSNNKLTKNQIPTQSLNPIRKPSLIIKGKDTHSKLRKTKEVMSEVTEGNEYLEITIDMRGIRKLKDILARVYDDNQLVISNRLRTHKIELVLPSKVISEPVDKTYKNGILTLKFKKLQN